MNIKSKIIKNFMDFNPIYLTESYMPLNENDKDNIKIETGLKFDKNTKNILYKFIDFLKDQLHLESIPNIEILHKRKQGMTYGAFDPNDNSIKVFGKNRGLADIFRTIAHELVHFWQKIENRIPENLKHRDTKLESEANTKAGDFIYMFGLTNPEIYEINIENSEDNF